MVFPLPLTPLEFDQLGDDQPDYPTSYPIELRFSGVLQRECFERARAAVFPRHPLLEAAD